MKVVILAAGKGTRMRELAKETPKPLLKYKNKTLLEHKFENLPSNTEEIILVIGYLGEKIKETFGNSWNKIPIKYIEQKEMKGTAHALFECKEYLNVPFMVLMADDLYDKKDLEEMSKTSENDWAILTFKGDPKEKLGKVIKDENGNLIEIREDLDGTSGYDILYTGACLLTPEIFTKEMYQLPNGEYGLPQTICNFIDEKTIKVFETNTWTRITAPEDLE